MLEMATCADHMLTAAIQALMDGDLAAIKEIVRQDDTVDRLDLDIESHCLRLIAAYQPVAQDLRLIGSALKVIADIERIGDYAVDIAKIGRRLSRAQELYRPLVDIPRLAHLSRAMLHDALHAFRHPGPGSGGQSHPGRRCGRPSLSPDARYAHPGHSTGIRRASYLALNLMFAAKYLER
jgi:phosphate transport system protein